MFLIGILHLLSGEWSSILVLTQVNMRWNILLPVGEGTAMLGNLVLPSILEHSVDILEWVETRSLIVKVFLYCTNEDQ